MTGPREDRDVVLPGSVRNLDRELMRTEASPHGGRGEVRILRAFELGTAPAHVDFVHLLVVPPGSSIGRHRHGDDTEWYVVLAGNGTMTLNGDRFPLGPGDVLVNPRFGEHELVNDSGVDLRVLVFAVSTGEGSAPRSHEVGRASVGS